MAPKKKESAPEDEKVAETAAAVITAPVLGESPQESVRRMAYESKKLLFEAGLRQPFHPNEVKWKPQMVKNNRCLAIAYLDARTVMDRLDDVVGIDGWRDEYEVLQDGSVLCRLTLMTPCGLFITKADVGSPSEQPDGGDRLKAAFSDSLKRAAVKFGIGRYIYRIPNQWVDYDPVKKKPVNTPRLPEWALPKKESPPPATYVDPAEVHEPGEPAAAATGNGKPEKSEKPKSETREQVNKEMDDTEDRLKRAKAAEEANKKSRTEYIKGRLHWWKNLLEGCGGAEQLTEAIADNLKDEPDVSKSQVWEYIQKTLIFWGFEWDWNKKEVVSKRSNEAAPY